MTNLWKAGSWLGVIGFAMLTAPSAQASGEPCQPGAKIAACYAKFKANHAKIPWYTYFPGDGAVMEPHAGAMYPTWPGSFPPPQSSWADQHVMQPAGAAGFPYPAGAQGQYFGQTTGYGPAPFAQPASNSRTSVPSYWFAR